MRKAIGALIGKLDQYSLEDLLTTETLTARLLGVNFAREPNDAEFGKRAFLCDTVGAGGYSHQMRIVIADLFSSLSIRQLCRHRSADPTGHDARRM